MIERYNKDVPVTEIIMNQFSWYIFGSLLIFLELIIPGAIVAFIGVAAIVVGLAIQVGWIDEPIFAVTMWFFISLVLVVVLRSLLTKFIGGETKIGEINEDFQAVGQIVEVMEDIPRGEIGRVLFRDTTWNARSCGESIPKGAKAKIVARDNIDWIVEQII
jgi:membrane protein implicated in regulation of membrane protease activity